MAKKYFLVKNKQTNKQDKNKTKQNNCDKLKKNLTVLLENHAPRHFCALLFLYFMMNADVRIYLTFLI